MTEFVIGLFTRDTDAEIALNNLAEADYAPASISVITNDASRTHTLTDVQGPLSSISVAQLPARLVAIGLPEADAAAYGGRLAGGAILIAIAAPAGSEVSAMEILTDQKADMVRTLPGSAGRQ